MGKLKTVCVVSDLHCGSRWGLRANPKIGDMYTTAANVWLWEVFTHFVKSIPPIDLLILNGDMIDGSQRRSEGTSLITTCLDEQTEIAIECLTPLVAKAKKTIRTVGTAYHESFHGPLASLDKHFRIKKAPEGKAMVRDIYLDGGPNKEDSVVLNVKHNPEGEGALYRGTTLDREARWAVMAESAHDIPKANFIVRSHIHFASAFSDYASRKTIITTPCWCLQQPYATEKRYYGWKPVIGGLLLERDGLASSGWRHLVRDYKLPPVAAETFSQI